MWAKDPDTYSGGVTNAAYVIMKRDYAPAADRLKALIAREKKMPAALQEARKNLDRRRRRSTRRSPSNRSTATSASSGTTCRRRSRTSPTRRSWPSSRPPTTRSSPRSATTRRFSQKELLPKASGELRLRRRRLRQGVRGATRAVDLPLDRLLQIAEADRQKNEDGVSGHREADRPEQAAPTRCWRRIDSNHPPAAQAPADDAGRARLDPPVHRRSPHHHDPAVGSGAGQGDAAVHALDDHRPRWTRRGRSRRRSCRGSTT